MPYQADHILYIKCFYPFLKYEDKTIKKFRGQFPFSSKMLHIGWVIKQLFHGCLVKSPNYRPSMPLRNEIFILLYRTFKSLCEESLVLLNSEKFEFIQLLCIMQRLLHNESW